MTYTKRLAQFQRSILNNALRRAIPPMEALLASTMDSWPDDTEDEILAANIRKGEQVTLMKIDPFFRHAMWRMSRGM